MAKRPPHMLRRGLVPYPMSLPLPTPAFGWLLHPHIERWPPTAMALSPSLLFFVDYFDDWTDDMASPSHVLPWSCVGRLLFGCCVLNCKMAATLKPRHPPSLYFLIPLFMPPQTSKSMTANASPTACGLCMALGSGGPWFDGAAALPTEREGKAAGE